LSGFQKFIHKTLSILDVEIKVAAFWNRNWWFNLWKSGQNVENREFFSFCLRH